MSTAISDVIFDYVRAATAHGVATESGDYQVTNSAAKEIAAARRKLLACGAEGRNALMNLLNHPDRGVRLWAASHALEFAPEEGERVLSDLAPLKDSLVGLSAEMTLRQWRAGQLRFA